MASVEIERKFLLSSPLPFSLQELPHVFIRQGYIALEPDGKEVRIRQKNDQYFLTVKEAGTLARQEIEIILSAEQFAALWPNTLGRRLEKNRFIKKEDGYLVEIDQYMDGLKGLLLAEVEFPSLRASEQFVPFPWFGQEVTNVANFKNRELVLQLAHAQQKTNHHE
jgi:adenylate cyclase